MGGIFKVARRIKHDHILLKLEIEEALTAWRGKEIYRVAVGVPVALLVELDRIKDWKKRSHALKACVPILVISLTPRADKSVHAVPEIAVFPWLLEKDSEYRQSQSIIQEFDAARVVEFKANAPRAERSRELRRKVLSEIESISREPRALGSRGQWQLDRQLGRVFSVESASLDDDAPVLLTEVACSSVIDCSNEDAAKAKGLLDYYEKTSFDFVVVRRQGNRWIALLAIEHDGSVHQQSEKRKKDEMKNQICLEAGLTLLRVRDPERGDTRAVKDTLQSDLPARIAFALSWSNVDKLLTASSETEVRNARDRELSTIVNRLKEDGTQLTRQQTAELLLSPTTSPYASEELMQLHDGLALLSSESEGPDPWEELDRRFLENHHQSLTITEIIEESGKCIFIADCGTRRFRYEIPIGMLQGDRTDLSKSQGNLMFTIRDWVREQVLRELGLAEAYQAFVEQSYTNRSSLDEL